MCGMRIASIAGFRINAAVHLVRTFLQAPVIVRQQIRHRGAIIPEEPVGGLPIVDNAPGHGRQIGHQVVAPAFLELLTEILRPCRLLAFGPGPISQLSVWK